MFQNYIETNKKGDGLKDCIHHIYKAITQLWDILKNIKEFCDCQIDVTNSFLRRMGYPLGLTELKKCVISGTKSEKHINITSEMELENINCYLCGKRDETFIFEGKDRLLKKEGTFKVVKCNCCGLVYLNPRPTIQSIAAYYPPEYYYLTMPNRINPHPKTIKSRLVNRFAKAGQYERIKSIERFYSLNNKIKVLDLGCGNGNFLYTLREKRGCQGIGVELDPEMAEFCRVQLDLDVREGTLLNSAFEDRYFDVVTMWHYLEHEFNPITTLNEVKRILKSDGLLVIELPTIDSLGAKLFKSRWFPLEIPRHVIHYSTKSIKQVLNKVGFKVKKIKHSPFPGSVGSLLYLLGFSAKGLFKNSNLNKGRYFFYTALLILLFLMTLPLEVILVVLKRGDVIRVFAAPS